MDVVAEGSACTSESWHCLHTVSQGGEPSLPALLLQCLEKKPSCDVLTSCSRAAGMSLFLCAGLGRSAQQGDRSCDGGAAFSPPCLAPVLAHPVPFTGNKQDQELQKSGSEARRCCRAGEEEKPWVGHSRGETAEGSRSCDRHCPPARCHQGLLQKSSAGTFGFYQLRAGHCQHRPLWSGRDVVWARG